MNLEITLYVNEHIDVKDRNVKIMMKDLMELIIEDSLDNKNLFNFYKTKK